MGGKEEERKGGREREGEGVVEGEGGGEGEGGRGRDPATLNAPPRPSEERAGKRLSDALQGSAGAVFSGGWGPGCVAGYRQDMGVWSPGSPPAATQVRGIEDHENWEGERGMILQSCS